MGTAGVVNGAGATGRAWQELRHGRPGYATRAADASGWPSLTSVARARARSTELEPEPNAQLSSHPPLLPIFGRHVAGASGGGTGLQRRMISMPAVSTLVPEDPLAARPRDEDALALGHFLIWPRFTLQAAPPPPPACPIQPRPPADPHPPVASLTEPPDGADVKSAFYKLTLAAVAANASHTF